jgi:hypothetical protein
VRSRYHKIYGGDDVPMPVEAIAEGLLGLSVHGVALDERRAGSRGRRGTSRPLGVSGDATHWRLYRFGLTERPG